MKIHLYRCTQHKLNHAALKKPLVYWIMYWPLGGNRGCTFCLN